MAPLFSREQKGLKLKEEAVACYMQTEGIELYDVNSTGICFCPLNRGKIAGFSTF